jgi:acyl-[acyl-carrier-protein]-phospholipid O-acyltransferase/long-chain-fatty-acid--[acyl-carrier-protein] ligase
MMLLKTRRFLPLFLTQFMGAFNDNLLKNALVMLVTYRLAEQAGANAQVLVTLAAGLFILPFFLFSAMAGQCADKYDRARMAQVVKLVEIAIMIFAAVGFFLESTWFLMFVLFSMGVHSTFFGPIKFALLPQHLHDDELLSGNAYVEAGTFLAILLGTILGGLLVLQPQGAVLISIALIAVAVIGYVTSRYIPEAAPSDPSITISFNLWRETWKMVKFARSNRRVYLCIIGASWFWLMGATFLAEFPPYVKDVLHAQPEIVTLFLTIFSVGIGIGSFLCNKILRGQIHGTYVPAAALGMAAFGIDLYFASGAGAVTARILFDLLGLSVSAGLYIVPLYALMQHESEPAHRARVIAANNVVNAMFMVGAAIFTLIMLSLAFTIPQVFLTVSVLNAFIGLYIRRLRVSIHG